MAGQPARLFAKRNVVVRRKWDGASNDQGQTPMPIASQSSIAASRRSALLGASSGLCEGRSKARSMSQDDDAPIVVHHDGIDDPVSGLSRGLSLNKVRHCTS